MEDRDTMYQNSLGAGATSFTDFNIVERTGEQDASFTLYGRMRDDAFMDVETVNWGKFFTRVFCLFLLLLIIVSLGLWSVSMKFLVLAAIFCVFLIICIIGTYYDITCIFCGLFKKKTEQQTTQQQPVQPPPSSVGASIFPELKRNDTFTDIIAVNPVHRYNDNSKA